MIKFIPTDARKILDMGCGNGDFGLLLKHTLNSEVWGIDLNDKAIQKANKKLDHAEIIDLNKPTINLPRHYFDCVVFNDSLEHLLEPWLLLSKVKELLTSNGVVVCSIPNVRHIDNLYNLLCKKDWKYTNSGTLDVSHYRFFTMKSIQRMFTDLEYEIIHIEGINPTTSRKYKALVLMVNILTFFHNQDIQYLQFAVVCKPKT